MIYDKSQKINVVSHTRSRSGLRIVHENINRRTTDVLNAKGDYGFIDPIKLKIVKDRAIEKNEKYLEEKMRSNSPYLSGRRNDKYVSRNLASSEDVWTITNPMALKKNYNDIMTRIHDKVKNKTEEGNSIEFFKPESAFNTNRLIHPNRNKEESTKINRSLIAYDSAVNFEEQNKLNRSAILQGTNKLEKNNNRFKTNKSAFDFNVNFNIY
jgi:hypothetical protein